MLHGQSLSVHEDYNGGHVLTYLAMICQHDSCRHCLQCNLHYMLVNAIRFNNYSCNTIVFNTRNSSIQQTFTWGWIMWGHVCIVDNVQSLLISFGLNHQIFCFTRLTSQASRCFKCPYPSWVQVAIESTQQLLWHRVGGGLLRSSSYFQGCCRATTCSLSQYLQCEVCLWYKKLFGYYMATKNEKPSMFLYRRIIHLIWVNSSVSA